jgi:HK97 gp10 family phage protein
VSVTTIELKFNRLGAIADELKRGAGAAVAKAAHDIEAQAKSRAPVDTGALRNSIAARQEAALAWIVAVGVEYGIYPEFGTYKMGARPYLLPAFNTVAPSLTKALEALVK